MTEKPPFLTGWCEGPNHHVCREVYSGSHDVTYVCTCPCHQPVEPERVVKRVLRGPKQ
jgi:hypothetical protein